jgi:hypothetical protein
MKEINSGHLNTQAKFVRPAKNSGTQASSMQRGSTAPPGDAVKVRSSDFTIEQGLLDPPGFTGQSQTPSVFIRVNSC